MGRRNVGRRVYVRRRGPCPAVWLTLMMMAALMAFVFFARPTIQALTVDLDQAPESAERVTQEISFTGLEIYLVTLAQMDDAALARVEAARYVPRGAAGYVFSEGGSYQVAGNGYATREEAEKVAASLSESEDIEAKVLRRGAAGALLRVTATQAQLSALVEGEAIVRRLGQELSVYALALDRGERQAPVLRAALSLSAQEAAQAGARLTKAAGEAPNPVAAGIIELLTQLSDDLSLLAGEDQDTPLSFSSKLKYAYLSTELKHIDFLNGLVS